MRLLLLAIDTHMWVPNAKGSLSDSLCTEKSGNGRKSESWTPADSERRTGREQFLLANALPFSPAGRIV